MFFDLPSKIKTLRTCRSTLDEKGKSVLADLESVFKKGDYSHRFCLPFCNEVEYGRLIKQESIFYIIFIVILLLSGAQKF